MYHTVTILCIFAVVRMGCSTTPPIPTTPLTYSSATKCRLLPADQDLPGKITKFGEEGTNLLRYTIAFADYKTNPLDVNATTAYNGAEWHKVFNRHGQVLLYLAFNYDVLSLSLLQFGVVNLDIQLVDEPKGCFGSQDETTKIDQVRTLLLGDFRNISSMEDEEFVCHQVLDIVNEQEVRFSDQCCQINKKSGSLDCHTEEPIPTISALYYLLLVVKIAFLFYGPLVLLSLVYSEAPKRPTYIVPLTDNITARINRFQLNKYVPKSKPRTDLPENTVMTFDTLHISVDDHALMSEKRVPVGLFRFLIDNFLKCKITNSEPFNSCCSQSLLGSWSRYFLCLPLRKDEPNFNIKCKQCCSWRHIFVLIGSVLSLGFVSLPFIFRITIYYIFEAGELRNRQEVVRGLGLKLSQSQNIFQTITPTDSVLIFGYVCYFASFLLLALMRKFCRESLNSVVLPVMVDMQQVSYIEGIRMVCAHLILPLEKFGIFGLVIGLLYWPIALPLCIIALMCYCIPIVYLIGRFLIHQRPRCLEVKALPQSVEEDPEKLKHSLSCGAKSIDTILKLNNISPADPDAVFPGFEDDSKFNVKEWCNEKVAPILIGLVCIINMCALVAMYAEVVGFIAEIIVLTLMGAIINASSAYKFIMLAFWILMYTVNCYNQVYENYFKLNQKLFDYMKSKLGSQVMSVTLQKATMQKNTAFKYFSRTQIRDMCTSHPDFLTDNYHRKTSDVLQERKNGRLFWDVRSLVLFVDKNDEARIPRKLFFDICEEELEGCPGPVYKSLAHATKHLLYMVCFLIFVFLIILAYGSIYSVSTTNQLLLTLAGGFLPSIIRFVITPHVKIEINLNTYTFQGRIQQMLYEYTQQWPVAVLDGDPIEDAAQPQVDDHVSIDDTDNLVITETV